MKNPTIRAQVLLNKNEVYAPASTPFVRDSLADDGSTPNNGNLNMSPDIIPQQSPVNPSQVQALFGAATFGTDSGQNIESGQANYIYLRLKNPTGAAMQVTISVYWARPSTLQYPSQWQQNLIGVPQTMTIPANSVMAAPEPAIWTPLQLPGVGHYCLIAELTWAGQPPVPASFPDLNAWWQYCRDNNTIAQRNIDVINNIPDTEVDLWLDLINPTATAGQHLIQAICNVPQGSTVTLYSAASTLNPPIFTGAIPIIGTNNNQIVSAQTLFPANFQGTLEIRFIPPAVPVPGSYTIVLQQYITDGATFKMLGSYNFEIII